MRPAPAARADSNTLRDPSTLMARMDASSWIGSIWNARCTTRSAPRSASTIAGSRTSPCR
jgi:hypothetical protein